MTKETNSQSKLLTILTIILIIVLAGVFWVRIRPQSDVDKGTQATATSPQNKPTLVSLPSEIVQIDPNTSPLTIFEQSPPPTPWPMELKHYDGWELGYSFDYPADWIFSDIEGVNFFEFETRDGLNNLFGDFSGNDESVMLYLSNRSSAEWQGFLKDIDVAPDAPPAEILATGIPPFGQDYTAELMGEIQTIPIANVPTALVTYHLTYTRDTNIENPRFDVLQALIFLPTQALHFVEATATGRTGNALNTLRIFLNSFEPVDYTGWQRWDAPSSSNLNEVAIAYPPAWNLRNQAENPSILDVLLTQENGAESGQKPTIHIFEHVGENTFTSQAATDELLAFYTEQEDWTEIEPFVRLEQNPLAFMGVYQADEEIVLLGTIAVFNAGPRKYTDMMMRIAPEQLDEMRPIFERVLRSIRPKSAPPLFEPEQ